MNKLKEKLSIGKNVLGTWCEIPSPEFINVLAKAGLDFVIIDMEHGTMDFTTASRMVMAAQAEGCSAIIRVSRNGESEILRALEIAPQGIIVPHIESPADTTKALSYTKFPPVGTRSYNPFTRAGGYHTSAENPKEQNTDVLLSLIVEGKKGIHNLEKIVDENVDSIYIGTYDISMALGIPGDVKNKKVTKTLEKMVKTITRKGKVAGCMFHDENELTYFKSIGIQFLCYKADTSVIFDEFQKIRSLL